MESESLDFTGLEIPRDYCNEKEESVMYHVKVNTSVGLILDTVETVYREFAKDNELGLTGLRLAPATGESMLVVLGEEVIRGRNGCSLFQWEERFFGVCNSFLYR